ncbi:MAG: FG-GAP-like repeat-containing protein [Armatimonadota bacterium]
MFWILLLTSLFILPVAATVTLEGGDLLSVIQGSQNTIKVYKDSTWQTYATQSGATFYDVKVAPNKDVYASDQTAQAIYQYRDGIKIGAYPGCGVVYSIAIRPCDGAIFVLDTSTQSIKVLSPFGTWAAYTSTLNFSGFRIAFGPDKTGDGKEDLYIINRASTGAGVYYIDGYSNMLVTSATRLAWHPSTTNPHRSFAWGPDGKLYIGIATSNLVSRFSSNGTFEADFLTYPNAYYPNDLEWGPDWNGDYEPDLFVANYSGVKVSCFTSGGTKIADVSCSNSPLSIDFVPEGYDSLTIPDPYYWLGQADNCVIIRVDPRFAGGRPVDSSPARIYLDFNSLFGFATPPDLSTMQVIRYDPDTGDPITYPRYNSGLSLYDVPFRFDFDDLDLKTCGYRFNIAGKSTSGYLVWTHTQTDFEPSYYAVYADPCTGPENDEVAKRPYIGDSDPLHMHEGSTTLMYPAPYIVDSNGDGSLELVLGTYDGHLTRYKNKGTTTLPDFAGPDFVRANGAPIYPMLGAWLKGTYADWDDDGDLDMLVGAERGGRVLYFQNTAGAGVEPVFTYQGELTDEYGNPIRTPYEPCPELPIYTIDYGSYPEVVDWNGDGKKDLLLGGHVTGYIMYYRNVSSQGGTPILRNEGALRYDSNLDGIIDVNDNTIDVGWIGSPTTADINGDGKLELISGGTQISSYGKTLRMYINVSTQQNPVLQEVAFPTAGTYTSMVFPRIVDWNLDGLKDMVIYYNGDVSFLRNDGTSTDPLFVHSHDLTARWEPDSLRCDQAIDIDGNGGINVLCAAAMSTDILPHGDTILNPLTALRTANGGTVCKPYALGDTWNWCTLVDWKNRGVLDLLLGDSEGYVWYYTNLQNNSNMVFCNNDDAVRLELQSGGYVKVGLDELEPGWDEHVGNRATPKYGDFNSDGVKDLIVGDAYGGVTYFRNVGTNTNPLFADGQVVLTGAGRSVVGVTDWNMDGLLDLVVGWASETYRNQPNGIRVCLNTGTSTVPQFGPEIAFDWPFSHTYPAPVIYDWDLDGQEDMLLSGYGNLYFVDKTFLQSGYAAGSFVRIVEP